VNTISSAWARTSSRPLAPDLVLAMLLLVAALVSFYAANEMVAGAAPFGWPNTLGVAAGLSAMVLPLALRRRLPLTALLACTGGFLASRLLLNSAETATTIIVMSIALYSAAAHGRPPWRSRVGGFCLVAVTAELLREQYLVPGMPSLMLHQVFELLVPVVLFCAMWALGGAIGAGRRRAKELLEQTVELERGRAADAHRAVFDERVRIARELHDVVAHHVSIMGVQAGAARVVIGRDPAKAKEALVSIEGSSRQAVLELHRLLGFLRRDGDAEDLRPLPGLSQLASLAATMSDAQLTVEIRVVGDQRPLAPTVDVSAYRIVQEALTNTLKHSGASHASVYLRYHANELDLEITDDGRASGTSPTGAGGLGLIGMRERAGLHGGELTAGPVAGGGFAVRVTLPTLAGAL